ncbi:hypothetical protein [Streptosporangium roseum]
MSSSRLHALLSGGAATAAMVMAPAVPAGPAVAAGGGTGAGRGWSAAL